MQLENGNDEVVMTSRFNEESLQDGWEVSYTVITDYIQILKKENRSVLGRKR